MIRSFFYLIGEQMSKITVIVSDLGNVLIPFDYSIVINKLNKIDEGLGDRFAERYEKNYRVHRAYEKWELTEDEFTDIMLEWVEGHLNKTEFCKLFSEVFTVNEKMVSLLPKLKKNYKMVLLSNTNYIHRKFGWGSYPFIKHFEKLILSYEIGALKPEPAIYKAVEEYTKRPPEEHIFIDDVLEYAEAAKKLGWDAIHFKSYEQTAEELKKRGILF